MKIPVYPRLKKTSPEQAKNHLVLLFPNNSDTPLLRSDLPSRETAESVLRGWFELEPSGKGIIIASFTE